MTTRAKTILLINLTLLLELQKEKEISLQNLITIFQVELRYGHVTRDNADQCVREEFIEWNGTVYVTTAKGKEILTAFQ